MSYTADFVVIGDPQPKGSWKAFVSLAVKVPVLLARAAQSIGSGDWRPIQRCFRANLAPDAARSKDWERAVRLAASRHAPPEPLDCPVAVEFYFVLREPKKPRWWCPAVKPDWDKLARSTGDALSGVIYRDDARVVRAIVSKEYGRPGCRIVVRGMQPD